MNPAASARARSSKRSTPRSSPCNGLESSPIGRRRAPPGGETARDGVTRAVGNCRPSFRGGPWRVRGHDQRGVRMIAGERQRGSVGGRGVRGKEVGGPSVSRTRGTRSRTLRAPHRNLSGLHWVYTSRSSAVRCWPFLANGKASSPNGIGTLLLWGNVFRGGGLVGPTGFRDRPIQPLSHLSGVVFTTLNRSGARRVCRVVCRVVPGFCSLPPGRELFGARRSAPPGKAAQAVVAAPLTIPTPDLDVAAWATPRAGPTPRTPLGSAA